MDLISVIVPVYKVEPYLRRCIDSILAQTHTNLEVILVDDGSPDQCGRICDEYSKLDKRIVVLHQQNQGLSMARNAGLSVATGEYISFVDSDDTVASDFLEVLLSAIKKYDADIAECGRIDVYNNTQPCTSSRNGHTQVYTGEDAFSLLVPNQLFHQTVWNKLYKRIIIGDHLFPADKLHEDEFFTWKVFCNCARVVYVDDALYHYYHRENSIMETFSSKRLAFFEARLERHQYIVSNRPDLAAISKQELLLPCIFMTQKLLHRKDQTLLKQCIPSIQHYYDMARMTSSEKQILPFNLRVWLAVADKSLFLCAYLRNVLRKPC